MNQFRSVRLPEELCEQADRWCQGRFDSLEALITFALREIVNADSSKLDLQEEEMVQQRLRDLGYI
jgi:Arc/MetJ-type ribon-helix-helix transcriptional regulator